VSPFADDALALMHDTGSAVAFHQGPTGAPVLAAALAAGALSMNLERLTGTLTGTILAGATFTVAGEAGTPAHTVSGGPYTLASNAVSGVTFTPAIAAGGAVEHAAVTFGAAHSATGLLQLEAAMLSGEFAGDNVGQVAYLLIPAASISGLLDGQGVLVGDVPYSVRKIHTPDNGLMAAVILARPL
jgi:hypothetical protein